MVPEQQVGSAGSSGEGEGESGADETRRRQVDSREVRKKTLFYPCMNESRTTTTCTVGVKQSPNVQDVFWHVHVLEAYLSLSLSLFSAAPAQGYARGRSHPLQTSTPQPLRRERTEIAFIR